MQPIVSSVGRHKANLHGFAWGSRVASAGRESRTVGLAGDRPEHWPCVHELVDSIRGIGQSKVRDFRTTQASKLGAGRGLSVVGVAQ